MNEPLTLEIEPINPEKNAWLIFEYVGKLHKTQNN